MKMIILIALLLSLMSCSKGVDGFRDIKLGMKLEDLKSTETCKEVTPFGVLAGTLLQHLCSGKILIDKYEATAFVISQEGKIKRVVLVFNDFIGTDVPQFLYDSLSGQYGDSTKSKASFLAEVSMLKTSIMGGHRNDFFASADWKKSSVQLYIDMEKVMLFYQPTDFYDLMNKEKARGKGL